MHIFGKVASWLEFIRGHTEYLRARVHLGWARAERRRAVRLTLVEGLVCSKHAGGGHETLWVSVNLRLGRRAVVLEGRAVVGSLIRVRARLGMLGTVIAWLERGIVVVARFRRLERGRSRSNVWLENWCFSTQFFRYDSIGGFHYRFLFSDESLLFSRRN